MADYYCDVFTQHNGTVNWHRAGLPQMHIRSFDASTYLYRDQATDVVFVSSPNRLAACGGKTQGNYPGCFDEHGVVWVQHDTSGVLHGYNWDGSPTDGTLSAPYAAEGIASVNNGQAVMMNDPSRIRVMPNGETWLNCVETEHYIVGQFGHDASGYGGSISSYNKTSGQVLRWLGYTPLPIFAKENSAGQLYVAISGNEAPAPDQVTWATHFPGQVPPVEPPIEPPVEPPYPPDANVIHMTIKPGQTITVTCPKVV